MSETTNAEKTDETAGCRFAVGTLRYSLVRLLLVGASMLLATQSLALLCNHLIPGIAPVLMDRCGASAAQIALMLPPKIGHPQKGGVSDENFHERSL